MQESAKFNIAAWIVVAVAFGAILLLALIAGGCSRPVYMAPQYAMQFNQFAAAVADWDRRCSEDPNTCAESLRSMAEEMRVWVDMVNGADPNTGIGGPIR